MINHPEPEDNSPSRRPQYEELALVEDVRARDTRLVQKIALVLAVEGPRGWERLRAVFAMTAAAETARMVYFSADEQPAPVEPTGAVLGLVRELRSVAAELRIGPWWRLTLWLAKNGRVEVIYDYGDEPFPSDQLFSPQVYRADLRVFPRDRLPVWLAAYTSQVKRQSRTPLQAAARSRVDAATGVRPVQIDGELPTLAVLWSRWAVLAATSVATRSPWGPRIQASIASFEEPIRSGCALHVLPGGRAVLSGGLWNAPELDAAYNDGAPMPDYYAGAPTWVADPVLDQRASTGLLSFCYWFEQGNWHRGQSPAVKELEEAIPGIWTADSVLDSVVSGANGQSDEHVRSAAAALLSAAEIGTVTRACVTDLFGADGRFDIDGALEQFTLAGLTRT